MNRNSENTMGQMFIKRRSIVHDDLSNLFDIHEGVFYIVNSRKESNTVDHTYSCMSMDEIAHENEMLIKMYEYLVRNFANYRENIIYKYIIDNLSKEMTIVNEFYCRV